VRSIPLIIASKITNIAIPITIATASMRSTLVTPASRAYNESRAAYNDFVTRRQAAKR
jgi:hypothetical protein